MLPSRFSEKIYWEGGYSEGLTLSDVWNRNVSECPGEVALSDSQTRLTWKEAVGENHALLRSMRKN